MSQNAERLLFAIYDEYVNHPNKIPSIYLTHEPTCLLQADIEPTINELINKGFVSIQSKQGQDYYTFKLENAFKRMFSL